jgi:hypothetical protein
MCYRHIHMGGGRGEGGGGGDVTLNDKTYTWALNKLSKSCNKL